MSITVARQAPGLPVGFKLVLFLLLVAGIAVWLEPRLLDDPRGVVESLIQRIQLKMEVTRLAAVRGDIMAIEAGPDGAVWVAGKNQVVRFPGGTIGDAQRLLYPEAYKKRFGRRMDALSTIHVTGADDAWLGTWYGGVLRYHDGRWIHVSRRGSGPEGRIAAIVRSGDVVYVGGQGLWSWSESSDGLRPVPGYASSPVTSLASSAPGELLVGTREGVLIKRGDVWETLWRTTAADVEVSALYVGISREILVGTHDGYVVLDAGGRELFRELDGIWITGFSEAARDDLWVATWQDGIFLQTDGLWRRLSHAEGLEDSSLSALLVDGHERLWMGIYGEGVSVAKLAGLRALAAREPSTSAMTTLGIFKDVCEAAASRLGEGGESAQVAVEIVDGRPTVFFNGRQVCPDGVGFRRDAGTLVVVADRAVKYRSAGEQRTLPLPARVASARPSATFVDSAGRIWLGFHRRGLYVFDDGAWYAFGDAVELAGNPVKTIVEDADGAIWVATYPTFDLDGGDYRHAGLHRYDERGWSHFHSSRARSGFEGALPRDDLPSAGVNSLRLLSDGRIAVATNGGLALHDNGSFTSYSSNGVTGLDSNFIADVVEDPDGSLWLIHAYWGHGVTRKNGFLFNNRSTRDGLFHDRIANLAVDGGGNVWLVSVKGTTAIYRNESLTE